MSILIITFAIVLFTILVIIFMNWRSDIVLNFDGKSWRDLQVIPRDSGTFSISFSFNDTTDGVLMGAPIRDETALRMSTTATTLNIHFGTISDEIVLPFEVNPPGTWNKVALTVKGTVATITINGKTTTHETALNEPNEYYWGGGSNISIRRFYTGSIKNVTLNGKLIPATQFTVVPQ